MGGIIMELSPNDQVLRALFKINEECRAILRAMDEIETQNGNGTKEEMRIKAEKCPS